MLVFFTLKFKKVFHHLSAWAHHVIGDAAVLQKILTSHLVQEICLPWNSSSGNSRFKLKGLKPCGHWNLQRSSKYEKHMVTIMIQLTFAVRLGWHHHLLLKYDRSCFFLGIPTVCLLDLFLYYTMFVHVYTVIFFFNATNPLFFSGVQNGPKVEFYPGKACLLDPRPSTMCSQQVVHTSSPQRVVLSPQKSWSSSRRIRFLGSNWWRNFLQNRLDV